MTLRQQAVCLTKAELKAQITLNEYYLETRTHTLDSGSVALKAREASQAFATQIESGCKKMKEQLDVLEAEGL